MKRVVWLAVLALAWTVVPPAAAQEAYPVIEEPVLKPDSDFEATTWGYKKKDLDLPDGSFEHPALLVKEGYGGAGTPNAYLRMDDGTLIALRIRFGGGPRGDYALVNASTRGTECSGSSFNLYDRRHAWDGHHIIQWIAEQPWSNGRVGMHGSSFSGQTAYWIAATQPPALHAVSSNALHSDIYRDIFMPGGVQNYLFPTIWTYGSGPHRLPTTAQGNGTLTNDEICAQNQATRYGPGDPIQPQNEPAWAALRSVDDQWYTAHAALTYAPAIKIPYFQQNNWQDEQTGPRAAVLFHHIDPTPRTITGADGEPKTVVPKKMALSTGDHGWGQFHRRDLFDFLDIWLLDMPDVNGIHDAQVEHYWETRVDQPGSEYTFRKTGQAWPFPDTDWQRFTLHGDGSIDRSAPAEEEASATYLSGIARQNWFWYAKGEASDVTTARGYPDAVAYESDPLEEDLVVAGPVLATINASILGLDTDFYVTVSDIYPDGSVSPIQRGLLKASHRRVDPQRSYCVGGDGLRAPCTESGTVLTQPYRPHTNPQYVIPGEVEEYQIEVFPIGHVFREGHRVLVQIHTPPVTDGLWGYTPTHHAPGLVSIHHDAANPSWIQLPVVQPDAVQPDDALLTAPEGCTVPGGFPCTPASALNR